MAKSNKASCNTFIDTTLIEQARELNLSPSAILEEALCKAVKTAKYERWFQANKQAIEQNNRKIDEQGTFSEKIQQL